MHNNRNSYSDLQFSSAINKRMSARRTILVRITIYILFIILNANSSVSDAQIKSGYRLGVNMTTMSISYQGMDIKAERPAGVHFGGIYQIPFDKKYSILSGFLFSSKGTDYKIDNEDLSLAPAYLEIPANLAHTFGRRSVRLALYGGPYFAAAFGGYKLEEGYKILTLGPRESKDLKIIDYGFNFGIGIHINSHLISIQYGTGSRNVSPKSDMIMKNKVIGISISSLYSPVK